jgi:hypothetical protein
MKTEKVLAWHFTDGMKLRDGQPLKVGKVYKHMGPLVMCSTGYHASVDIRDALSYAPGFVVSCVECSGEIEKQVECSILNAGSRRRDQLAYLIRMSEKTAADAEVTA